MIARPKNRYFLSNRPQPFYPRNYLKLGADAFQADKKRTENGRHQLQKVMFQVWAKKSEFQAQCAFIGCTGTPIKVCQCWVLNAEPNEPKPR